MRSSFIFNIFFNICCFCSIQAQGVLFTEHRIYLDNKVKNLQICNPTEETRFYQLSFVDKTMSEEGKFIDLENSITPYYSLKKNLRLYPKNIKLEPNECQEVQIQIKNINDLDNGEYRSHLQLLPLLKVSNDTNNINNGVDMRLFINVMPSIPIIYRKKVELIEFQINNIYFNEIDDLNYLLTFSLLKSGTSSVYGDILIEKIDVTGEKEQIANIEGLAVYGEANKRIIKVPIPKQQLQKFNLQQLPIKISFIRTEYNQNDILDTKDIIIKIY